jgi:signal transduction histidine kinase
MTSDFWNRKIFSVRLKEYAFVAGFYTFFTVGYYVTLWLNRQDYVKSDSPIWSFSGFGDQAFDYAFKLLLTIPIWWLIFRVVCHWKLWQRLSLHIIFLPAFALIWQRVFYAFTDYFEYGHLQGSGQVWDVYIPGLFYVLQFGIFHGYEYYVDNQNKLKLEAELRESVLKSELSALKAQLNPHFLYNVFNTISASLPPEQEQTREMIANLSDLFRYQLRASQSETVPLKDELDFVKQYLDLEKARFENRLKININVDERLMERHVPPMILQPLVENAIKHGISGIIEGGEITISIKKKGERIHFEIADTGVGIKDKSQLMNKGVGLTNTKLRLEKMFHSTIQFTDNQPSGLKVSFSI